MIIAAYLGLVLLLALTIFQIFLIAGAPIGEYAWGGQHKALPKKLRVSSIFSIALYGIFAVFLASKAGIIELIPQGAFLDISMWVITGYFILGIFMNLISRSKKERLLMTPMALMLALSFLIVTMA